MLSNFGLEKCDLEMLKKQKQRILRIGENFKSKRIVTVANNVEYLRSEGI